MTAAREIAAEAGALIKELQAAGPEIRHKGAIDIVTDADLKVEEYIKNELSRRFPDHAILAEEGGGKTDAKILWVVDPIDGTTNFAHGFPIFAVSIGVMVDHRAVAGAVFEPNLNEMFTATLGGGAFLNDRQISVSTVSDFDTALLATGFPYTLRDDYQVILADFQRVILVCQGVRRAGAATIDLCFLACGRVDGFWERGLKPWDTAAAALVAAEAGAVLTKYDGSDFDDFTPELVASNGALQKRLLELLQPRV